MKELTPNLRFRQFADFSFIWIPRFFSAIWLTQSVQTLFLTKSFFGPTALFIFGNVHTLTVMTVCTFYLFLSFIFESRQELPVPIRVVTIVLFVSIGLHFNGYIWSVCNFYFGSHDGSALLSLGFLAVILSFLYNIDRKYKVVEVQRRLMVYGLIIFGVSLVLLLQSNFFQNWYLTETLGYPDPHNWQWGIEQFVAEWMWLGVVRRKK